MIKAHKTATAISPQGWVTVIGDAEGKTAAMVFAYGSRESHNIGAYEYREEFAALADAAKKKLEA